jgi:glutamyl-Q tRNA(Asp) synthetase
VANAALAFNFAQKRGGICLLRIEDIDTVRCKPEFETAIYEDLNWLGLTWPEPVHRQSEHMRAYQNTLEKLHKKGVLYRCFKTRSQILKDIARAPHYFGEPYQGPNTAISADEEESLISSGHPYAWRLSLKACQELLGRHYNRISFINNGQETMARPALLGDVILARKDVGTSYHLACCQDDAQQGITHIVRGVDLQDCTHIHRLLQELMNWPTPHYYHHELLLDTDGKRFAKRDQSITVRALRASGKTATQIRSQFKLPAII